MERGASTLEYIGAIVLAAILVAAIVLAVTTDNKVEVAMCKAINSVLQQDGSCGPATAPDPSDKDYQPEKCKYNEKGESYNSKVKILFIEIGDNAGLVETVYSDGSVELTATDGGSLGATGGVGADVTFGKLQAGAKVNFGGGLEFDYGSTWSFSGADGKKKADEFRKGLQDYLADQEMTKDNPGYSIYCAFGGCADAPRDPDSQMSSIKVTGDVSGDLGISLTNKTGTGENKTGESIPAAQVVAKVGADSQWAINTDNRTGDTTYTTSLGLSGSVGGQLWTATWGTNGATDVTMAITKNKDGKVVGLKFVSTTEGGVSGGSSASGDTQNGKKSGGDGSIATSTDTTKATVITTDLSIDPNDSAAQSTIADWLGGDTNYSWAGAIAAGGIDPSYADPHDPFQQLMHDRAKVSAVTYDNVKDTTAFGLNVKVGVALGFDFSLEDSESQAVAASYLGAPDASGQRAPVPYSDCVEGGN